MNGVGRQQIIIGTIMITRETNFFRVVLMIIRMLILILPTMIEIRVTGETIKVRVAVIVLLQDSIAIKIVDTGTILTINAVGATAVAAVIVIRILTTQPAT